jgi:hypothetical protein
MLAYLEKDPGEDVPGGVVFRRVLGAEAGPARFQEICSSSLFDVCAWAFVHAAMATRSITTTRKVGRVNVRPKEIVLLVPVSNV